ncbi:hypothetical protein H5410_041364 [Solanum commersonii]|uniref:Uncharacterized protein n=1 Tax=Solanum commersonii TaxID=4109 RepID=A0A9J5XSV1_SOLCO|nr:hypothetical protein H5410_041364 [Solanum commersonii]
MQDFSDDGIDAMEELANQPIPEHVTREMLNDLKKDFLVSVRPDSGTVPVRGDRFRSGSHPESVVPIPIPLPSIQSLLLRTFVAVEVGSSAASGGSKISIKGPSLVQMLFTEAAPRSEPSFTRAWLMWLFTKLLHFDWWTLIKLQPLWQPYACGAGFTLAEQVNPVDLHTDEVFSAPAVLLLQRQVGDLIIGLTSICLRCWLFVACGAWFGDEFRLATTLLARLSPSDNPVSMCDRFTDATTLSDIPTRCEILGRTSHFDERFKGVLDARLHGVILMSDSEKTFLFITELCLS